MMKKNNLFHTMLQMTVFTLPMSAGAIINAVAGFISMIMVAQLGKYSLAAGSLAIVTFMTMMTVILTMFYAIGILVSHARSQNKTAAEMGLIVKNGFWLAFFLACPGGLVLWHADKLLLFFKQDPQLIALTPSYFHFAAMNLFPLLAGMVIAQFYAGIGKPRFTLVTALISLPFTVLAAYGLILGHFGLPQLGLGGITCASLIVQSSMLVIILIIMYFQEGIKPYELFKKPFLPNKLICKSIFTLGTPIGMQFGGEFIAIMIATYLMGHFGVTALAASQIVSQYYMLSIIMLTGLTQALSILISEAWGRKNLDSIKLYLQASTSLLLISCSFIGILFCGFPHELIRFYGNKKTLDAGLQDLTVLFFIISTFLLFIDSFRHLLSGALRGLHDSKSPMRIGIFGLWFISLPVSYLFGFILHGGPVGMRIGFLSGFTFAAILLFFRIRKRLLNLSVF